MFWSVAPRMRLHYSAQRQLRNYFRRIRLGRSKAQGCQLTMSSVKSPYFTRLRVGAATRPLIGDDRLNGTKSLPQDEKSVQIHIAQDATGSTKIKEEFGVMNPMKEKLSKLKKRKIKVEPIASPETSVKREPTGVDADLSLSKKAKWMPTRWVEQLENIRKMRANRDAPVDIMGCERCKGENYSEKDKRFHILISLMLSSQTKDHITYAAMLKLVKHGLSADSIANMPSEELGELIYPVGFWKKKIVYLKKTAVILRESYGGDIPDNIEDLVKLPGVGPKMAYLTMNCAWNKVVGIGVDVHVHRITNRLKWVRKSTADPEKTRKELEDWLPKSYWKEVNWLLVGFGQQMCLPTSPRCSDCLNKDICPSSSAKSKKKGIKT